MQQSSLRSLPGRYFQEPAFAWASTRFADAVSDELIRSAEIAAPEWRMLADEFPEMVAKMSDEVTLQLPGLFHAPFVRAIAVAWVKAIRWPVIAHFSDGIQLMLPDEILNDLRAVSSISNVEFYLAHLADICTGRLGSDDHNTKYGLYLNLPIWIPLAVREDCRDSFARQIRMVVHHEAGHFRWRGGSLRAEQIAHARGVAGLAQRTWPRSATDLAALLETEHPEAWSNPEIRSLVLDTQGGARLVRAWGRRRNQSQDQPG